MPVWQRALWVFVCLAVCWILEGNFPLFRFGNNRWKHARVNMIFLTTTMIINGIFGAATVGIFSWISSNQFGLIYLFDLPVWVELLICVLLFELIAQYTVHYLLHRVKWMWKFHMIHHSDTHLDATSGTRHHPGDFILREIFALGGVILTGAPAAGSVRPPYSVRSASGCRGSPCPFHVRQGSPARPVRAWSPVRFLCSSPL